MRGTDVSDDDQWGDANFSLVGLLLVVSGGTMIATPRTKKHYVYYFLFPSS